MLTPYGLRSLSRQDPDYNNSNIIISKFFITSIGHLA